MLFTRTRAAIFVSLLVSSLTFTAVWLVARLGSMSLHSAIVMHAAGEVISVGPARDFILETARGEKLAFVCQTSCQASLKHLQRHLKENAHTDVYYVEGPHDNLLVIDAD